MKRDKRWLVCEKCYNEKMENTDGNYLSEYIIRDAKIKRAVVRDNYNKGKKWGNYYMEICYCLKDGKCNNSLETTVLEQKQDDDDKTEQ